MGRSRASVNGRRIRMGMCVRRRKSCTPGNEPPESGWAYIAMWHALLDGQRPAAVLAGTSYAAARCRQRAWKSTLETYPQASIIGLGRVSGFDHTTILYGLRRLGGATRAETAITRASGRSPIRLLPRN